MIKNIVFTITLACLALAIWAIDSNADRINELEIQNATLIKETIETRKDIESCVMENSILNDRVDEAVRKFS